MAHWRTCRAVRISFSVLFFASFSCNCWNRRWPGGRFSWNMLRHTATERMNERRKNTPFQLANGATENSFSFGREFFRLAWLRGQVLSCASIACRLSLCTLMYFTIHFRHCSIRYFLRYFSFSSARSRRTHIHCRSLWTRNAWMCVCVCVLFISHSHFVSQCLRIYAFSIDIFIAFKGKS